MTLKPYAPSMLGEEFSATLNGKTITIPAYGVVDEPAETLMAYGGEINEFPDLASVDQPGLLRQQHDGTAVLDLRQVQAATTLTGTKDDGTRVAINVSRCMTKHGWAPARYYMLERDANEDLVIERGDDSRDIYVSTDPAALTSAAIGAAQTPALTAAQVTGAWLVARPQYGGSAAQKVSIEVANKIKTQRSAMRNAFNKAGPSDWYYLEAGKPAYTGLNFSGTGENPLHPFVITRFGTGANPTGFTLGGNGASQPGNIVFIGVTPNMRTARGMENVIVADTGDTVGYYGSNFTSRGSGLTFYRMNVVDAVIDRPYKIGGVPVDTWYDENANRWSGSYWAWINGSLAEACFYDHNGWSDTYQTVVDANGDLKATLAWNNGEFGQPPSNFSHNIYTQTFNGDMSYHEVLSMRAASVAGQQRVGGWQMSCVSIDNPLAFQNSGVYPSDIQPQFADENSFFPFNFRSVAHIGNARPYGVQQAKKVKGFDWQGARSTDIDCISLHAADPDDPADIALKLKVKIQEPATWSRGIRYSNFVAYNWRGAAGTSWSQDINTAGLVASFMDQITVLRWAGQQLAKPDNGRATIQEFSTYMRGLTPRQRQLKIRELNRYLISARGAKLDVPLEVRTTPQTLTFKPDWRGEGRRSDNPINWSTKDNPIDGDSLNLFGNPVTWVRETRALAALTVGNGGLLDVSSGKVSFTSAAAGSTVQTSNVGKLHINAFDGKATVRGGRFSVSAASAGSIEASGWGEVVLGPSWTVRNGETLRINGDLGKIGWDAVSAAGVLTIKSGGTLEIHASPVIEYAPYKFHTWDFWLNDFLGQTSGASAKFDSVRRMGERSYARLRNLTGTPVVGELTTKGEWLAPANGEIFAIHPAVTGKIEAGWAGRSGTATGATHSIVLEAGAIVRKTGGNPAAGPYDITGPGITVTNQGANLGAGFSVTGGKLIFTA